MKTKEEIENAAEKYAINARKKVSSGSYKDCENDFIAGATFSQGKEVDIEKLRDEYKKAYYKIMGYNVDFGLDDEGHESNGARLFNFFKPRLSSSLVQGGEKVEPDFDWMEFIKWYSGVTEDKILNAIDRFRREV